MQSDSRVLMTKNFKKFTAGKNLMDQKLHFFLITGPPWTSKLQKKTSAIKREYPALQSMKFLNFFLFLWVIFALYPDQDSESGSRTTNLIESGSGFETLPQGALNFSFMVY
jgi:hypothetical protein